MDGHEHDGAAALTRLAEDTALKSFSRVQAAKALSKLDGHQDEGAALLARLANEPALGVYRVQAAKALAKLDGHEEDGVAAFTRLAEDPTLDSAERAEAAMRRARFG